MLNLPNSPSTVLRVITGSAGDIKATYSAVDAPTSVSSSSSFTPTGPVIASITAAGTNTIVPAPGASLVRNVKQLTLRNHHASISNLCTLERFDGTNATEEWKGTLLPGEAVYLNENGDWTVEGADGIVKATTLANQQQLAAATAFPMTAADTDTIKIFARKRAGNMQLKWIKPSGLDERVQEFISENGYSAYLPNNGTTVGINIGLGWTSGGTVSHPTPSTTSPAILSQQKRTRWANVVTTTNQFLGLRTATAEKRYWRGNAAGLGGFNFHCRWNVGLIAAATTRWFVGLNDSNAGWAISDTLTGNGCGFWHDTTDAINALSFVTKDNTTATKSAITLGSNLTTSSAFDCWIWSAPNGGVIGYALLDLVTNTMLVDTTTSTTIPLNTAFLGQEIACSNGTANITATTVAIDVAGHSCTSDN